MNNWLNIIQNKCLPPRCILCDNAGMPGMDLCLACYQDLPHNAPCCPRCAAYLTNTSPLICGHCLSKPPAFDDAIVPFRYQDSIPYLVTRLKYHQQYAHARLLGILMSQAIAKQAITLPECLIPVPLHIQRYRERGFNQSQEIAQHLGHHLHIPIVSNICQRIRNTPHQTGLSAQQRRQNLQNAFAIKKTIDYQHIGIIDDVITTATTAHVLARTLKQHGVRHVSLWAFARA